jgi:hypothetical protein
MPKTKDPAKLEANARRIYGCSRAAALFVNGGLPLRQRHTPAMAYTHQRTSAGKRGVEWEISFPEWMAVWLESGRWELRGVGRGRYCMARHGDTGPYKVGNVSIQLATQNSRDGVYIAHRTLASKGRTSGVQAVAEVNEKRESRGVVHALSLRAQYVER